MSQNVYSGKLLGRASTKRMRHADNEEAKTLLMPMPSASLTLSIKSNVYKAVRRRSAISAGCKAEDAGV